MANMTPAEVKADFDHRIKDHRIEVVVNTEQVKHLNCAKGHESHYSFQVTCWPGHTAITGDTGSFVFSRGLDFFRGQALSPDYAVGKLCAMECSGVHCIGALEFDFESAYQITMHEILQALRDNFMDSKNRRAIYDYAKDQLTTCDEHEVAFSNAIRNINNYAEMEMVDIYDIPMHHWMRHTSTFLWCLHAIQWAVATYDREVANHG